MTTGPAPHCMWCRHYDREHRRPGLTCAAYPDGIPDEILSSSSGHWTSRGDDHNIVFEIECDEKGVPYEDRWWTLRKSIAGLRRAQRRPGRKG